MTDLPTIDEVTTPRRGCEVCLGAGWVCEEHTLVAFDLHPECGVGEPCRCTPYGKGD